MSFLSALSENFPVPVGSVFAYAGSTHIPRTYLLCDGSTVSTTAYPELFSVVGYTYGGADESFNLPNLVNLVPAGSLVPGTKSGGAGGTTTTSFTLGSSNIPQVTLSGASKLLIQPTGQRQGIITASDNGFQVATPNTGDGNAIMKAHLNSDGSLTAKVPVTTSVNILNPTAFSAEWNDNNDAPQPITATISQAGFSLPSTLITYIIKSSYLL